jgi:hypothetical protein
LKKEFDPRYPFADFFVTDLPTKLFDLPQRTVDLPVTKFLAGRLCVSQERASNQSTWKEGEV